MAARFRKLDPRLWNDEGFRSLKAVDYKLICLYILTAQSNRIGLFSFSPGKACEDLGIDHQTFLEGLLKVCQTFKWEWDQEARVIFIPTWWKYNTPENPNVLKSCLADLHDLPKTPLVTRFSDNLRYLPETFHQTFLEGLLKPSPQPCPNQEKGERSRRKEKKIPLVVDLEFDEFWLTYPARNGKRLDKLKALKKFGSLPLEDRKLVLVAVKNYALSELAQKGIGIKDPHRWLRNGKDGEPWRDWLEPEKREGLNGKRTLPRDGFESRDYQEGAF